MVNINSRANEFAADKYAATLGMGDGLATGLIKISIGASLPILHAPRIIFEIDL